MDYFVLVIVLFVAMKGVIAVNKELPRLKLIEFLSAVQKQKGYESVLVLKDQFIHLTLEETFFKKLSESLEVPVILLTEKETFFLASSFNNNILTIVFLESWNKELLNGLLKNLHHIRSTNIIFILQNQHFLAELFQFCWKSRLINVLAVLQENFDNSSAIYSYNNFPAFVIEKAIWSTKRRDFDFFPNRLKDIRGYPLPIHMGGPKHAVIITQNQYGDIVLKGFLGHLFNALLKKHNATFDKSFFDASYPAEDVLKLVLNETIEISAAGTYPEIPMDSFTYPYKIVDWCLLLPVEPRMSISKVILSIFHGNTLIVVILIMFTLSVLLELASSLRVVPRPTSILNYFFNDSILRGILGQAFFEVKSEASITIKLIYLLIFILGLNILTLYAAFLQTFNTHPPSEKIIQSFDDLLASKLKVYSWKQQINRLAMIVPTFKTKYYDMFYFEKDFTKYNNLGFNLDTKFAYVFTNIKWTIIQHQQETFSQPIFRFPKGMCLIRHIPLVFPIYQNSMFKDMINFLLLEVQAAGLMDFWERRTFYELVEAGTLDLTDLTEKKSFVALNVTDLMSVWIGFLLGFAVSGLCFLGEIWTSKWKIRKQNKAYWMMFLD